MKKSTFLFVFWLLAGTTLSMSALAQSGHGHHGKEPKLAYVDMDSVLNAMPETMVQKKTLESYAKQLKAQFAAKETEFKNTYQTSIAKVQAGGVGPEEQQKMQAELQKMQSEMEQMQGRAEADLMRKENELLTPLYEKIKKAVAEYAKTHGYTYVFSDELTIFSAPQHDITSQIIAAVKQQ